MSNRSLLLISTALAAVFPAFAAADPRGDSDEIVVTASMGPEAAGRLGSAISVIDAAAIAARQTNDLAVLLREVPGLAVSRTGPFGSFTQIRVRGAEANHTLALVDGIEVADPTGSGEFDFANALAFDLDRIEIVRGAQSALYGSDALGGVVNILTRGPEPGYSAYALAEAGSFGTWRGGAAVNAGAERAGLRASVHYARTDGVSAARGGSEADGEDALHLKAKGFVAPADWLAIDGVVHFGDVDVDTDPAPFGLVVDSDDTTKTETLFARGAVRIALGPESYLRASLGYARTKRDVAYRDFFTLGTPLETSRLEGARTKSLLELGHGFATGALTHRIGIVAEHEAVTFESANSGGLSFADQDRSTDTASLAGEYRLSIGAHTNLSAGGRLDRNGSFEDAATWRLTASQDVDGLGGRLHASYGTGIKEPSFTELYGFFPGSFVGNPDLGTESSRGFDIGWQQRLFGDQVRLDATYFETDLKNEITTVFVGFSSTVVNEPGKSERKGVELAANADLGEGLSLEASYTWLDAENADGSAEVRRARNISSAALDWSFLEGRGHLNVALRYNGTQEDDDFSVFPARRVDLDGFLLAAVAARFDLTDRVALTARVEDLLDEAPYEVFGYAEPGRAVFAGLTLKLGGLDLRGWVPIVTLAALLLSMPAGAAGPPQRIVSLNVCADQLLLGLVPRGRIVALSKFAADPTLSPVAEVARSMKRASGRVDEVLALEPDFVVAGTSSTRLSVDLLRRLGTPVFELATAEDLSTIRSETMRLARALDAEEAGRAMIAAFDARLAGLERPATQASPRAAIFLESGMTLGPETLSGRVLALAGYRNAVQELGIQGFGHLSLEALVRLDPDLVVVGGTLDGGPALASSLLSHPALAELRAKARFVPEPRAQWVCGGPAVADALARLVPEGAS